MLLTPSTNYSRGTIKRMRRHGRNFDIVLDEYMEASDTHAPFGLLTLSHKTGKYIWFNRKCVHVPDYEKLPVPNLVEDVCSYTSCYDLFDEYLDRLIKIMPKKGKERYVVMKEHYKKKLEVP